MIKVPNQSEGKEELLQREVHKAELTSAINELLSKAEIRELEVTFQFMQKLIP